MSKHLLERPDIPWIQAKQLFIDPNDLSRDQQRHPEDRKRELINAYGEHGERFSLEHCGTLKVKPRGRGKYAIKDGGGRWWTVMNLLKKPELKLPCVLMEKTSDLEAFVVAQKSIRVPAGKVFMALSNDPKNVYEHRVGNVLKEQGFTATPGNKSKSVKINHVIFAYDLGVLRTTLMLASRYWSNGKDSLEGLGLAGLAGFLFTYGDKIDPKRLHHILSNVSYEDLKESARQFLPKNKEHGRQWAAAMAKEIVERYNLGIRAVGRLDRDELATLQRKVMGHEHYKVFGTVWEMRQVIKTAKKGKANGSA